MVLEKSALFGRKSKKQGLQFPHSGKFHGFRASGLSAYDNVDPHTVVRELVQNALDASVSARRDVVRLIFEIEEIPTTSIPGRLEYEHHLECAIDTQRKKKSLEQAQSIVGAMRRSIKANNVPVLWVLDNGIGLDDDGMERLLGDGQSAKADESTAGSYGNGHMTSFPASDLRYVLYGGVQTESKRTVSGHAILATHIFEGKAHGEDGYLSKRIRVDELFDRFDFYDGSEMPLLRSKLDYLESKFSTGSVVGILGFNKFNRFRTDKEALDTIADVVATHFAPLILDGGMEVVLRGGDQAERLIDRESLEKILDARKSRLRRERNSIGPSGAQAWDALETLSKEPVTTIETKAGNVRFHFRELPRESGGRTHIQLFRNGMWISNDLPYNRPTDFAKAVPFCGVVLLQPSNAQKACRLVRSFEGPRHIDIDLTRKGRSSPERLAIEEFFRELGDRIRALVPKVNSKEHDPGFFSIEVAGDGVRNDPNRRSSGVGNPERVPRPNPPNHEREERRERKSGRLRRQGTLIESKTTAIRRSQGIRVYAKALQDAQNAELRVVLASGSDETCDTPEPDNYLEISNGALVGGRPVKSYVQDQTGARRAVLIGPVSADSGELDIWLPCRSVPSGNLRVELVRRSAAK